MVFYKKDTSRVTEKEMTIEIASGYGKTDLNQCDPNVPDFNFKGSWKKLPLKLPINSRTQGKFKNHSIRKY